MQLALKLSHGWHIGVLFEIIKRRQPKPQMRGVVRRRVVRKQTPQWADRAAIRRLYAEARHTTAVTGVQHSVDHIVPLTNTIVCGLHTPENLRVIVLGANMQKSNIHWPDMPFEQLELL